MCAQDKILLPYDKAKFFFYNEPHSVLMVFHVRMCICLKNLQCNCELLRNVTKWLVMEWPVFNLEQRNYDLICLDDL